MANLSENQRKILELMSGEQGNSSQPRWWSAMDVVEAAGSGTGPGIGCAMKGLYTRGLLRRWGPSRQEGRLCALYQITEAGLRVAELERIRVAALERRAP